MSECFDRVGPHTCKYCGKPSWIDPSDQSPPPDYCLSADHGRPPEREEESAGEIGWYESWGIWCDDGKKQSWMKDIYGHPALFSETNARSLAGTATYLKPKKLRVTFTVAED